MRTIGIICLVLAVVALFATIWVTGYRIQTGLTAGLLLIVGAAVMGQDDKMKGTRHE